MPSRSSLDLIMPCSLSKGSPKLSGFFGGGDVYCILISSGQKACSNARRLGTSGGGVVDQGWPLLFAMSAASAGRIFSANGNRCGH